MKALLNLKDGDITVEHLLGIAERTHDLHELVNAEFTDSSYKGVNIGTFVHFWTYITEFEVLPITVFVWLFSGQTALHIAIEKRKMHYAELLIEKRANVHARACGTFFKADGEKCFYFGKCWKDIMFFVVFAVEVQKKSILL